MKTTDYTPIPCADYSQYELAIMHCDSLHLIWEDAGMLHNEIVLPLDLNTRSGAEFLVARNGAGRVFEIRLDRIRRRAAS